METLRYPYKAKIWVMALSGLFFAGCAVLLAKSALENDRGLILDGIIHLGVEGATRFYWLLVVLSAAFVVIALFVIIRSFGPPQEIVLDSVAITAPRGGLSNTLVTVPLHAITDLRITTVQSQKFLVIRHVDGKLTVNRAMLPREEDFEVLAQQIDARRRALRVAYVSASGDPLPV